MNDPFGEEDGHSALIETSGSLALPSEIADTALVVAPFQLRGEFQFTDASGKRSLFALTGQGRAVFFFVREPFYQSWYLQRVELDIEKGRSR